MVRKPNLSELLVQGYGEEKAFYNALSPAEREQKGKVDDWAAKDLIAHNAYWKKVRVDDIQRVLKGKSIIVVDDFDHENEKIFELFSNQSWGEVKAYAAEAAADLAGQLEELSEEDLELEWHNERPLWAIIAGNGYSHPLAHIAGHYQQKGDIQLAAEITGMLGKPLAALDDGPTWIGQMHYNTACRRSLLGKKEEAIDELRLSLKLWPDILDWSKQDSDLDPLRNEPAFQALYENEV